MLDDDARMTRAALYNMGRERLPRGDSGFSETEIYDYANERRAVLTFQIAGGLAQLVRVGEVRVSAGDERRFGLTAAGAQIEEAYRVRPPTARQVQILERLEAGKSAEEIANDLRTSSRAIEVQIIILLELFDVGRRSELLSAWKLAKNAGRASQGSRPRQRESGSS